MPHASPSPASSLTLAQRCVRIELLVVDVDGVLTRGGIQYAGDGVELKTFHVRDGSGLKVWHQVGKRSALITGRASRVVEVRAAELGIEPVVQGVANKLAAYRQILAGTGFQPEQAAFVGDDLPDLPILGHCGLAVAVAAGCGEVGSAVPYVTRP